MCSPHEIVILGCGSPTLAAWQEPQLKEKERDSKLDETEELRLRRDGHADQSSRNYQRTTRCPVSHPEISDAHQFIRIEIPLSRSRSAVTGRSAVSVALILVLVLVLAVVAYATLSPGPVTKSPSSGQSTTSSATSSIPQTIQTSSSKTSQSTGGTKVAGFDGTLRPNGRTTISLPLTSGRSGELTWNSTGKVDVFLFTSSQYAQYQQTGATSPSVVSRTSVQSGDVMFCPPETGGYVLVVHNSDILANSPPIGASASVHVHSSTCS